MFSRIVVPLDGTPLSERAIPVAREIARRAGGNLRLVRVHVPERLPATSHRVLGPRVGEEVKRNRAEALRRDEEYLETAGTEAPPPEVSTQLLRGPGAHPVVDDVRRTDASLVVVSAPVPGPGDEGLDPETDTVVRLCQTPVLVLRREESGEDAPRGFRHILVPLDGTERSETVLPPVEELARLFGAPLTLIRVMREGERDGREAKAARRYLDALADGLQGRAVRADTVLAYDDDPSAVILRTALERETDLIAMASRCRGPLTRLVLGSVSEDVLRRTEASVLVAHPAEG